MPQVYLGLGSNLGDRRGNIQQAVALLSQNGLAVERLSSIIETDPVGGPPQDKFLNAALKATTELTPLQLLSAIKKIENQLGRRNTVRNGPRTIDLDILLYDDLEVRTPELTIPHPRMLEREFVLRPLGELMPAPIKNSSI